MRSTAILVTRLREACLLAGFTFVLSNAQAADNTVAIEADAIRISVQETSLRNVLDELSRQTGLVVRSQAALDQPVSLAIVSPTLGEAIRRMLGHRSYMLFQSNDIDAGGPGESGAPARLWIFADDSGHGEQGWTALLDPGTAYTTDEDPDDFQALVASERPSDRQEAMYSIADLGDTGDIAYLEQGMTDHDDGVREAAILALGELGGTEAVRLLGRALYDSNTTLRMDAVDALGDIGDAQAVELLQQSLARQPDTVREAVAARLTEIAWQPDRP